MSERASIERPTEFPPRHSWRSGRIRVWIGILVLVVLPSLAAAAGTLRMAVISDLNGSYGSTRYAASVDRAVDRIIALRPDIVISTGDMVAGQRRPHLTRPEVESMWKAFHERVSNRFAAAGIPLVVTPGNHDGSAYTGFGLEREVYAEQWASRRPEVDFLDDAGYPFQYAFALDDVLFISLDATVVGHLPGQQMEWLRQILGRFGPHYQRRVVFSHMPLWPLSQGREREYIGDPGLHSLLRQAHVEVFLSGHHHAFYPGSKDGIAFIGQACLGAGPRKLLGTGHVSAKAFTLVRMGEGGLHVGAYAAPGFESPMDWQDLPTRIGSRDAGLIRADLDGTVIADGARP